MAKKLLLMHPGAFAVGTPSFEQGAVDYATARGFACVNLNYPLCDPVASLAYCVNAAATAAQDGSDVYAYGDSAGAALALRLAQKGRAKAAAGYSPPMDWTTFVRTHSTPVVDCIRHCTDAQLNAVSAGLYSTTRPIVIVSGVDDCVTPHDAAVRYARAEAWAWVWAVPGGHLGDTRCLAGKGGPGNATYDANMKRAINWLADRAGL